MEDIIFSDDQKEVMREAGFEIPEDIESNLSAHEIARLLARKERDQEIFESLGATTTTEVVVDPAPREITVVEINL